MVQEMHYEENTLFDLDPKVGQGGQGHTKCCPVPSTSCDLCTSKVWCCYILWLRRRYIYKKIHYLILTLGSRSYKMLPSTLDIVWPMHLQSLILLHPTIKEKMHLQVNTLFDLDLRTKCCPLHHVTYAHTEFEVTASKGLGREIFTRKFNIQYVGQYPLHHMTYPAQSLKLQRLTVLEEIHLQENTLFNHTKCCPVPSTAIWPIQL